MVKIKEIPISDRPMERLILKGKESLSNEELLAILLKTGKKGESSKDIAIHILKNLVSISDLNKITLEELKQINGIGESKASIILAAIELGKRIYQTVDSLNSKKGNNPTLIFEYYKNILKDKTQEYFYAVYLDQAKKIIKDKLLFIGTLNYSLVHPRDIFKEAYILNASSIILVHNHPTGNISPSPNDIDTTSNLIQIGNLLGIKIVDHIIIGKKNYYSFFENGCFE